ncbi:MAG: OmpA family protein [Bacteroidetes bacterium]|nr:OmpA family protein [Bacteroidota bacterium]
MKRLFFLFFFLILTSLSFSQSLKEKYAQKLSSELRFTEAYPVWSELSEKTLKAKNQNWSILRNTITAAYNAEKYKEALFWSQKLARSNKMEEKDWIKYLSVLQITNKHSRLSLVADSAAQSYPQSKLIQSWKKNIPLILQQLTEISEYSIASFRNIKSGEEFCAVPYQGGYVLVSNRRNTGFVNRNYSWTGQFFTDLVAIDKSDDISQDELWKEIKRTNPHDGPIAFSSDNKIAILTVNNPEIDKINKVKFSRLLLKIYRINEGKSSEAEQFQFNDKAYSVGHGVFDLQGNLIFASDKPGGLGGVDLYKSEWKDGKWSEPVNLGDKVNTVGDELFPYVSNGGILYFSSNGWPGNGGLDVFYQENQNTEPKHIGNPINSCADDFGIYIDEFTGKGLLSSNRNAFKDEIYTISKPVLDIDAEVFLSTCDNKPLSFKNILVTNLKTTIEQTYTTDENGKISVRPLQNSTYQFDFIGEGNMEACSTVKTFDAEGTIQVKLSSNYKDYKTSVQIADENGEKIDGAEITYYAKGTIIKKTVVSKDNLPLEITAQELAETDSITANKINFQMGTLVLSENGDCNAERILTIVMKSSSGSSSNVAEFEGTIIYFDLNSSFHNVKNLKELDAFIKKIKGEPSLKFKVVSHCDRRETDQYNIWLSKRRMIRTIDYLVSKGISKRNITGEFRGEREPDIRCVTCSEEEFTKNRRTIISVLK